MIEKFIFIGKFENGISKSTNDPWYRVHYLDADSGVRCLDYVSADCYQIVKNANLPYGTKVIGIFTVGRDRQITLDGLKIK